MKDAELLEELSTLDEVNAWIPTGVDHDNAITPPWCELVLEIKRTDDGSLEPSWPLSARLPLRRHDGELIGQVLHDVLHPGVSNITGDRLWDQLDEVYEQIMRRVNKGRDPLKRDVGMALGLATAIAIVMGKVEDSLEDNVDDVRATAVERYELRHGISGE